MARTDLASIAGAATLHPSLCARMNARPVATDVIQL